MAKKAKGPAKKTGAASVRVRQLSKKQAKQKAKKEAGKQKPILGSFKLTAEVFADIRRYWKPLGGIALIYSLLNVIFASGFLSDLNSSVNTFKNHHNLNQALSGYGTLIGNGSGSSSAAQSILLILESLVIIWALRHLLAGDKVKVKQAYYQSMTPLIPFLLIVVVIIIQLLPLTVGGVLLALVLSSVVASSIVNFIFAILLALLAAWSIYMLSSSVFALYIVTLPDMQPRQALHSAKNLVRFRRWQIVRRLVFLPISVVLIIGAFMVPLILLLPFMVTAVFFALVMASIIYAHTYLYSLYRSLIA